MRALLSLCFGMLAFPLLSGCVAALIPLAAAGALGKQQIDSANARKELTVAGAVSVEAEALPPAAGVLPGISVSKPNLANGSLPIPGRQANPEGFAEGKELDVPLQELGATARGYLARVYKSTRAGGGSPYADFTNYALEQAGKPEKGAGIEGAVLVPSVNMGAPKKISCNNKPLGVIIDLDTPDMAAWSRSETLYRQDGLAANLERLRAAGVTVIWMSDLPAGNAFEILSILKDAGLSGGTGADDFLFLDRGGDDRKQERRWDAARSYCIAAIAGDKRSDFDELFDYLRNADAAITLEHMFGSGWFIAPPPLVVPSADVASTADAYLTD